MVVPLQGTTIFYIRRVLYETDFYRCFIDNIGASR